MLIVIHRPGRDHEPIRLDLRGGTNATFSPSYDYMEQVLLPNFQWLGLPRTTIHLKKRGWSTGPADMGEVIAYIYPDSNQPNVSSSTNEENEHRRAVIFPSIDLSQYNRGKVTSIDITILAPDDPVNYTNEQVIPIRQYIQQETNRLLRYRLRELPSSVFKVDYTKVPINVLTSERTTHRTHIYLLLVAHTTTGFRLARDALLGEGNKGTGKSTRPNRGPGNNDNREKQKTSARNLVERCVKSFMEELFDPKSEDSFPSDADRTLTKRRPCVDVYCRDQVVLFEALGRQMKGSSYASSPDRQLEDERYWSLHTRTAMWVCEQMLSKRKP